MPYLRQLATLAAVTLVAISCRDTTDPDPASVTRLQLGALADTIGVGDTLQVSAATVDGRGIPKSGVDVSWTSTAPSVVRIDPAGRGRALAAGDAWIVARASVAGREVARDSVRARVVRLPRALRVTYPEDSVVYGSGIALQPTVQLVDGLGSAISTPPNVRFASSDTTMLRVDSLTGRPIVLAHGTADVVVTAAGFTGRVPLHARWYQATPRDFSASHVSITREVGCARSLGGAIICWGRGASGQLGNGMATQTTPPTPVTSPVTLMDVASSRSTLCGRTVDGALYCWGSEPVITRSTSATAVQSATRLPLPDSAGAVAEMVQGWYFDKCARTTAGRLWCWGSNTQGAIGPMRGSDSTQLYPRQLAGAPAFVRASTGEVHGCGVTAEGELWCWGGYLSAYSPEPVPYSETVVRVMTPRPVRDVAMAFQSTCIIDDAGAVDCWGYNQSGAVGVTTSPEARLGRTRVDIPGRFTRIKAGGAGLCALNDAGQLWCWGAMANTGFTPRRPFLFARDVSVLDFAMGSYTSAGAVCIIAPTRRVLCNHAPQG